ncbi:MAG TPA: hypothetical protein PLS29_01950 [Acidimicrobiales bacterium]|nr:MAG: hypothetical protein B7Z69_02300 [Actinobacteria bacterium 21-73-9]HQU25775.1 hypothetical protein [Acidimicrobiales bacterium]
MNGLDDGLLDLASVAVLALGVAALWRRDVRALIGLLRAQGVALALVASVEALSAHDVGLGATAVLVLALKAGAVPWVLGRVAARDPGAREGAPLINVPSSLVLAAALVGLAVVTGAPLARLSSGHAAALAPLGLATALVGYLVLVTRRRPLSQIVGLIIIDNGVALVTFLLTSGVPLIIELGGSLDVLLVVVVSATLVGAMRARIGADELDELEELRD